MSDKHDLLGLDHTGHHLELIVLVDVEEHHVEHGEDAQRAHVAQEVQSLEVTCRPDQHDGRGGDREGSVQVERLLTKVGPNEGVQDWGKC